MKEDTAKTKWCPMTRVGDVNLGGSTNVEHNNINCIASGCMMWRETDNEYIPKASFPSDDSKPISYPAGYCGLAGKL